MSTHPAYLNLDTDEAERALAYADNDTSRPFDPEAPYFNLAAALNDLGVVLRWETLADRDAFAAKEANQ